jgi:hypothetical protein
MSSSTTSMIGRAVRQESAQLQTQLQEVELGAERKRLACIRDKVAATEGRVGASQQTNSAMADQLAAAEAWLLAEREREAAS